MNNLEYIIKKEDIGKKYIQILKNKMYISSRILTKLKKEFAIKIDEKPVYVNLEITEEFLGKKIIVELLKTDLEEEEKIKEILSNVEEESLDILYEDAGYICINKDTNVAIHPCSNHRNNTALERVQLYMYKQGYKNKIHVVNRLDRETSGVCIFAKHAYYQESIEILEKRYYALCMGNCENHMIIEKPISREEGSIMTRCIDPEGQYAKTEFFKIKYNAKKDFSLVDILLYTGRTHQIRVHFKSIGHSLLGDGLYNTSEDRNLYINRVALHSHYIKFINKENGKVIEVEAPLKEDMKID